MLLYWVCFTEVNGGIGEIEFGVKTSSWVGVAAGSTVWSVWWLALANSDDTPNSWVRDVKHCLSLFCPNFLICLVNFPGVGELKCSFVFLPIVVFSSLFCFLVWLHRFLFGLICLFLHLLHTVIFTGSASRKSELPCFSYVQAGCTFLLLKQAVSVL